jgi:ParB-like chromosome segregation protein Spo0J
MAPNISGARVLATPGADEATVLSGTASENITSETTKQAPKPAGDARHALKAQGEILVRAQHWGHDDIRHFAIEDITVPESRLRQFDEAIVTELVKSVDTIGDFLNPIDVRWEEDSEGNLTGRLVLDAGLHRLRAAQRMGMTHVPCRDRRGNATLGQLVEVAENLHRAELTALERADHIAKWMELSKVKAIEDAAEAQAIVKGAQVGHPSEHGGQQPHDKGVSQAARELNIPRQELQRAVKIAGITPEAKAAAKAAGVDDNQSKLLEVAEQPIEKQVEAVAKVSAPKPVKKHAAAKKKVVGAGENITEQELRREKARRLGHKLVEKLPRTLARELHDILWGEEGGDQYLDRHLIYGLQPALGIRNGIDANEPDIRDQLLGQYDPDSSVFVGRDPDWDAACEALEAKQVKPGPDDGIPDFLRRAPKAANGGAS